MIWLFPRANTLGILMLCISNKAQSKFHIRGTFEAPPQPSRERPARNQDTIRTPCSCLALQFVNKGFCPRSQCLTVSMRDILIPNSTFSWIATLVIQARQKASTVLGNRRRNG